MGRPSITGPTIVVAADGLLLAWCEGYLSGDYHLAAAARELAEFEVPVKLGMDLDTVVADLAADNPRGALAAMFGAAPGRAYLVEGPDEVRVLLGEEELNADVTDVEEDDAVTIAEIGS